MKKLILFFFLITCINVYAQTNTYWEVLNFPDTLVPKTINAQRDGILYVSASGSSTGGLYRSYDEGQTWEVLTYDSLWHSPPATIQFSLDNVLFIGTVSGIYRSTDYGNTFENVYSGYHGYLKYVFSPENHLYTVGWGLSLITKDLGNSWDTLCNHGPNGFYSDIAFGLNGELYAVGGGYHPSEGGFYRSIDDGESWQNIGITDRFLRSVVVKSSGPILVGGFYKDVYESDDNGETWSPKGDIFADVMETYGNDILIAGGNVNANHGCWFSEDWGTSWVDIDDDILHSKISKISISPDYTIYIKSGTAPSTSQLFKSINPILITEDSDNLIKTHIYPNPASSHITLFNPNTLLQLHSLNGQLILTSQKGEQHVSLEDVKSGVYVSTILEGDRVIGREKLIIR